MSLDGENDAVTLQSLRAIPSFQGVPDKCLEALAPRCRIHHFSKGDELFRQGKPADHFYALIQGTVKLETESPTGRRVVLHLVFSKGLIGAVVAIGGGRFPATAVALRRAMAMHIPTDRFLRITEEYGVSHQALLGQIQYRFQESQLLRSMQSEPVPMRLAHLLLLLNQNDVVQDKWLPLTKRELGTLINATTETCIRILSTWEKEGVVESGRGKIRVLNTAFLEQVVTGGD